LIDRGRAGGDRFCVWTAAVKAALGALRLRQDVFDAVGEGFVGRHGVADGVKAPL
jgi:hypothetical protein